MSLLPPDRVSAAALLALPWSAAVGVLALTMPATDANWAAADPILHILPRTLTIWGVPALGAIVAACWLWRARPSSRELRGSIIRAVLGIISAGLIVATIRALSGTQPPPFIPTEESAAPGWLLGMTAGIGEELVFRLVLVPPLFWALERRLPRPAMAIALTAVITGASFSLVHFLAPGDGPMAWNLSRFVLPGMVMTFAYLRLGPSFLVTAHCAAHIWIPLLFPG